MNIKGKKSIKILDFGLSNRLKELHQMEQACTLWVWEGIQNIYSDNLDSEAFYPVKVTLMIEHQSIEFREMLNLITDFWWYECWDVKKVKGWAPGILHLKHILYFQEPTVVLSTEAFVQLCHQLPQSQWNPQFTQKSSIWVQVKGEGITLIFFFFFFCVVYRLLVILTVHWPAFSTSLLCS